MDQKKIDELASIFAKEVKSGKDLNDLSEILMKATIESSVELGEVCGRRESSFKPSIQLFS